MLFFIKTDRSHEGAGVWLVRNREELQSALKRLAAWGRPPFLPQEFIACGGNVLRVVVLDSRLVCYWKRPQGLDQAVTTISP